MVVTESPVVLEDLLFLTGEVCLPATYHGIHDGCPLGIAAVGAHDVDIDVAVVCALDPKVLPVGILDECGHIVGLLDAKELDSLSGLGADEEDSCLCRHLVLVHGVRSFESVSVNCDGLYGIIL